MLDHIDGCAINPAQKHTHKNADEYLHFDIGILLLGYQFESYCIVDVPPPLVVNVGAKKGPLPFFAKRATAIAP